MDATVKKQKDKRNKGNKCRGARADTRTHMSWSDESMSLKPRKETTERERESEREHKKWVHRLADSSWVIGNGALEWKEISLPMKKKNKREGKLKKKKERKEKKGRKNSFWERILYASQPRCPLRGLVDDSYQFTFSFDSRIQHHCDQFVLYFRVVCQAKVNDPCAVV